MNELCHVSVKKRGRPATGRGQTVGVRMLKTDLDPLDAYIVAQIASTPSRPEAIRFLVRDSLMRLGYLSKSTAADPVE